MEEKLREYASLLVRVGLNVQRGQRLVISSPVECAYFARMCAQEAYDTGCKEVVMNWHDDAMARMKYLQADDEIFDEVALWRRHFFNDYALEGAGPAGQRQGTEGLRPPADVQRLSLVHRLHPHPQLGQDRVPGRQ